MQLKKEIIAIGLSALTATAFPQSTPQISVYEGVYFTDKTQERLYSGEYREFFDGGKELRLEMNIANGKPDGKYVVFFRNGKPNEVRSYKKGELHGLWRTYNDAGLLIAEANYLNGKKDGRWSVWDDNGILRYEMHYRNGDKTGVWYMWDEKGKLTSERKY